MEQGHTNNEAKGRLIDRINNPADLKKLDIADLEPLAAEIRDLIIETVARNGGHLAPSLGVVELTIALHYVFNSPRTRSSGMLGTRHTPIRLSREEGVGSIRSERTRG